MFFFPVALNASKTGSRSTRFIETIQKSSSADIAQAQPRTGKPTITKKFIEVKKMHNLRTLQSPIWLLLFVSDLQNDNSNKHLIIADN